MTAKDILESAVDEREAFVQAYVAAKAAVAVLVDAAVKLDPEETAAGELESKFQALPAHYGMKL